MVFFVSCGIAAYLGRDGRTNDAWFAAMAFVVVSMVLSIAFQWQDAYSEED